MLTLSMHDRIQRLIAEKEPQEHWWIKTQAVGLRQTKDVASNHDGFQGRHQAAWLLRILARRTMASQQWKGMWESQALWL